MRLREEGTALQEEGTARKTDGTTILIRLAMNYISSLTKLYNLLEISLLYLSNEIIY